MLNETPKKQKKPEDYSNPTKWKLFWRIQKECWRRMVTPYLMYLFMSLLLLSLQAIVSDENTIIEIVLGILCILGGAFFNGHLCYSYGILHYDAYLTGLIHKRNARLGIASGGDHHVEREYRWWKGFLIGLCIGMPVVVFAVLAHFFYGAASLFFAMFAGWAIIPITWFGLKEGGGLNVDLLWSMLFVLLPVVVSGVFYIVGAMVEKYRKENGIETPSREKKR